ncbi:hypothetical protein CPC08DRAFT_732709 [Agrocybe pediades]|nr:hypothetical protein CPC08DRAFT_732709 [Agrocybe pediades]
MPDWSDPLEIQKEAGIFVKFMHSLLGVYLYEFFISLDFEWAILTGKKKFQWPLIFYFANRYLLLGALIAIAVSFDSTEKLDCQSLYTFNQLAGDAAVGLASVNLSLRAMAIWKQNRWVVGGLVALILGHWSLILQGVQLTAVWVDGAGCQITKTNNKILAAIFIYSMCLDLTVLLLTTYKLAGIRAGGSRLGNMIFNHGLLYFFIAFLANLIATIFMVLDLNSIMSVIFNVPAAVASTIVACRAVRLLSDFNESSKGLGDVGYGASSSGQRAGVSHARVPYLRPFDILASGNETDSDMEMETFTRGEVNHNDVFPPSKAESDTDVEADIERKGSF